MQMNSFICRVCQVSYKLVIFVVCLGSSVSFQRPQQRRIVIWSRRENDDNKVSPRSSSVLPSFQSQPYLIFFVTFRAKRISNSAVTTQILSRVLRSNISEWRRHKPRYCLLSHQSIFQQTPLTSSVRLS